MHNFVKCFVGLWLPALIYTFWAPWQCSNFFWVRQLHEGSTLFHNFVANGMNQIFRQQIAYDKQHLSEKFIFCYCYYQGGLLTNTSIFFFRDGSSIGSEVSTGVHLIYFLPKAQGVSLAVRKVCSTMLRNRLFYDVQFLHSSDACCMDMYHRQCVLFTVSCFVILSLSLTWEQKRLIFFSHFQGTGIRIHFRTSVWRHKSWTGLSHITSLRLC